MKVWCHYCGRFAGHRTKYHFLLCPCGVTFRIGKPRRSICPKCSQKKDKARAKASGYYADYYRRFRKRHREKYRLAYKRNREKEIAKSTRYRLANREKVAAYQRAYYLRRRAMAPVKREQARVKKVRRGALKSHHLFSLLNAVAQIQSHGTRNKN